MNWVGGSRNRLVMRNDAKRQREFFEKRKMQQRLKHLGIALPESPRGTSCGSMDLVTLFIVNQIAAKKENKDPPKVAVLGGSKYKRNESLVLPMSPCSPSQLSFVESHSQYSVQGATKKKHVIPQGFRFQQLSPVMESAFSDNSASDYLPRIIDSHFSSNTSTASSGQGTFSLQLNPQQRHQTQAELPSHCSPPPWGTSGLEQIKFQPFSQPRGMTDCIPWSCGSNLPLYQLETPTAVRALFGSPETTNTELARHEVPFSLSQPEDSEPMLDFTLHQSDPEQQAEGDVFRGFSAEEGEREASHFRRGKLKIYLNNETPVKASSPQTVPDSQCSGLELSNCSDASFACLEHNSGPMNGCDCSPSYSCGRGYLSSDSNDEEECGQPSLQAASSYMDQACCADSRSLNTSSQGNPKRAHPGLENVAHPDEAVGSHIQQTGSHAAETQSAEPCKCKRTPSDGRDVGTQTADTPETCDASTQCSLIAEGKTTVFSSSTSPVDVRVQDPATRGQTDTAAEPNTPTAPPGKIRNGGNHTHWSNRKPTSIIKKFTLNNSDVKMIPQRPTNPFLDALSITDGARTAERRQEERGGRLVKGLSSEVREEVTSATRVSRLSEEAETLQEVANILLRFRQREK